MATRDSDFGIIENEFINLYSEENPILTTGEECFFMFNNTHDYHLPLIGRGMIRSDKYTDGMNKLYYIEIQEIIETKAIVERHIYNKPFAIHAWDGTNIGAKKTVLFGQGTDLTKIVIKLEAFFVRNSEEKIRELRKPYINQIKKDILVQLQDIENYQI